MGGVERGTGAAELRRGGSARRRRRSAPEDVAAVRQVLRAGDEPSVVAHSYGGIVTAEAAAGVGSVRHLLLVSSYLPEAGQSLSDSADGSPAPFLDVDPDAGTFGVRPARGHVPAGLRPRGPGAGGGPPRPAERAGDRAAGRGAAAGQQVPSTYLVCAQDRGTPPRLQREFARRAGSVVELDAGHHSFLSQPEAVRDLFAEPVTAAADEPGRRSEGQEAAVQPGHRRHRHPHRTEVRMALLKGAGIGGTPHHSLLGRAPEAGSLNTVPVERRIRPRASARSGRTGGHSRRAAGRGYGPPGRLPRVA
ncbi:alpha/beta hydrolase [Streptomyces sp. WAC05858]|uniref:alpha/beta hydrolase n=1 Tax=Streptomyces TaxID=1883 RepID=UPI000F799877|nr:alpha/beta hydrolase [Streptomyces sp. WAC05858]